MRDTDARSTVHDTQVLGNDEGRFAPIFRFRHKLSRVDAVGLRRLTRPMMARRLPRIRVKPMDKMAALEQPRSPSCQRAVPAVAHSPVFS